MTEKMANTLNVAVAGIDLSTCTNLQFYLRQGAVFLKLTPTVITSSTLSVTVPYESAMLLNEGPIEMQLCMTDSLGKPKATEVVKYKVNPLLNEEGYRVNS